jgi:NarL family two-component system response regulator LiaR
MKKIRTLVVDNEALVRDGFVTILSVQPDIEVVGEAVDGIEAVEFARKQKPDVVLLDLAMPRQDGLTTIPILKEIDPDIKILVLTSFDESDRAYQALKAGAHGYLLKDSTRQQLLQAVRDVAEGKSSIQASIAMKMILEMNNPGHKTLSANMLTQREMEVLKCIALGMSNQEIADKLFVHDRTVAKYVSTILAKLQLANRTQAALYAIRKGLTDEDDKDKKQE